MFKEIAENEKPKKGRRKYMDNEYKKYK